MDESSFLSQALSTFSSGPDAVPINFTFVDGGIDADDKVTVTREWDDLISHGNALDDGGTAVIQLLQDEPRLQLDAVDAWYSIAINFDVALHFKKHGFLDLVCDEVAREFPSFEQITRVLVLWCDLDVANIDPIPIKDVYQYYDTQLYADVRKMRKAEPKANRQARRNESIRRWSEIKASLGEVEFGTAPSWSTAVGQIQRIRSVANLKYHRKLKNQKTPSAADVVTAEQVATIVHLGRRTIERYRKDWPKPDIPGGGRRPAKWIYADLLPTLVKQFPYLDWGDRS